MGGVGSGAKPREYPAEIVERIATLYRDGMTITEVQAVIGKGIKVQNVMERYGIDRRPRVKRNQRGQANSSWRGDSAGYQALHLRVNAARGKPSVCERCGANEGRMEWANLTGDYSNVNDYARMCVSCHRRYDTQRRRETGRRTSPRR